MKDYLLKILKIVLPLSLGVFICWHFWNTFDDNAKTHFFNVFKEADYFIISLSLLVGLFSHYARAKRWLYVLKPMGYKPSLFNSFNSIMIGYIMNIVVPRMGEASRAGVLTATDNVPFEKGFGSIVAERFIDLICLFIICGIGLLINLDNLDDIIKAADESSKHASDSGGSTSLTLITYIANITLIVLFIGFLVSGVLWYFKQTFRKKVNNFIKGFISGVKSIFLMKDSGLYLLYTFYIWAAYVLMFWIPFYALDDLKMMPFDGIIAAFIMGTLGFIIVQGGLGVYPVMVGMVITFFLEPDFLEANDWNSPKPDHLGFGLLIWITQTVLVVVIGLFSFLMVRKAKKNLQDQESLSESSSN